MSRIDAALDDLRALDALAQRDTPLTRLDARAKLLVTLAFCLVVVSFPRHAVAPLLPLALYPVALAAWGDLPAAPLLRKLALAAPFVLLIGIFNPLFDTAPMLAVGPLQISGGWLSFLSILLRGALTLGAALVLVAGTGMLALCSALPRLGAPRGFATQLLFLHRYAFVLGGEAARMTTAHALRAGGRRPSLATFGTLVGHLLLRAFERARRIHRAMLARGFDGTFRSLQPGRWTGRDSAFVLVWIAYFALARQVDLPDRLGRLILGWL